MSKSFVESIETSAPATTLAPTFAKPKSSSFACGAPFASRACLCQENIAWLQIAMGDARTVRGRQRVGNLDRHRQRQLER